MAASAIACFIHQDYTPRELVIVDDGDDELGRYVEGLGRRDIRYVRVDPARTLPLGSLRNVSLDAARGAYFMQWDDDDWHAPVRIRAQVEALRGADACFLERWTLAWPARTKFGYSHCRWWEGTILARRDAGIAYPALVGVGGEDTAMVQQHVAPSLKVALLDSPDLYVYVCHGTNTFGADHFERLFGNPAFIPLDTAGAGEITRRLRASGHPVVDTA
jgi:glycosyltransferase involved in cell wall biosynthesis